jgi:hypothetical protein
MTKFCISRSAVSRSAREGDGAIAQKPTRRKRNCRSAETRARLPQRPLPYKVTKDMTPAALIDTLLRPPLNNGQP